MDKPAQRAMDAHPIQGQVGSRCKEDQFGMCLKGFFFYQKSRWITVSLGSGREIGVESLFYIIIFEEITRETKV